MKSSPSLLALLCGVLTAAAEPVEPVQRRTLDDRIVVTVPVATNRVTTIAFPGPIAAIDAAGVSNDPKVSAPFQLAHAQGSSFVSVRATGGRAATNLNIRWNRRTYVFELVASSAPILSLQLDEPPKPAVVQPAPTVSPVRLLALLDKAKVFPLLKQQHPAAVAQAEARTFKEQPQITDFGDCEIRIEEVFRFNPEDTLVFHVTLKNRSDREIRYQPGSFSVRVGELLFHQSISDASGVLPPNAAGTVFFAITGTPDGGRNELSLKNEFTVLFTRLTPPPPVPEPDHSPLPDYTQWED